jgi:MFS family permease
MMAPRAEDRAVTTRPAANAPAARRPGVRPGALGVLLAGSLAISTGYGVLLLLPLRVVEIGGDESDFGLVTAAAAVPAALAIGWLVRHPTRVRPVRLLAGATAAYGAGAVGVSAAHDLGVLALLGVVLGTAWAVVYTTTPMVVDQIVPAERRVVAFGFATGSQQVGIGAGPVLGQALRAGGLTLPQTLLVGAGLAAAGVVLTVALGARVPPPAPTSPDQVPLRRALRTLAGSDAARPLVLILLSACLFTTLTFFQTTYAADRGLSSDVFYVSYTVAVIVARFGLSRLLVRRPPALVTAWATTLLCLAVASFLLVGANPYLYAASSAATGIGYGLTLPLVQAQAVALSPDEVRPRALPLAGLIFETAILAFPLLAGLVIAEQGYPALFLVLIAFALTQTAITWTLVRRASVRSGARGR